MLAAEWFVYLLTAYASIGVLFAAAFVTSGMHKLDPGTREAGLGFRLIIVPGVAALWPLLLARLIRRKA